MASNAQGQTKKFQKGERFIPSSTDKALKYYPAEEAAVARKVRAHSLLERRWHERTARGETVA